MPRRLAYLTCALLASLTAMALAGCESSSVGTVTVYLSGVPVTGTQNVVVAITGVEVGGDGGHTFFPVSPEVAVDLDTGTRATLVSGLVPTGDYKWVRLQFNPVDSYVLAADGDRFPLEVPGTFQSTSPFVIGETQTTGMLVDIDLRKALDVQTQGSTTRYTLEPVSRLLDVNALVGIVGTAPDSLMIGGQSVTDPLCDPKVYVYQGAGAVPEGFFVPVPHGTVPYSSAGLIAHEAQAEFIFSATLLPPGAYTVAVTCAAADVPGSSSIAFSPAQSVVLSLGKEGDVTF